MRWNTDRSPVWIDIACNDPDNGNFAHRVEMIQLRGELLELEARGHAPKFRYLKNGFFRLSRKQFHSIGGANWVGNWCWDGLKMELHAAVKLLDWLHGTKLFDVSTGEERLFNTWKLERPFDESDRELLGRLIAENELNAGPVRQ